MDDLYQGYLPAGGAAHYFAKNCHNGVEVSLMAYIPTCVYLIDRYLFNCMSVYFLTQWARYLAVSQRELSAEDVYQLGLASHYVMDDAHDSLAYSLSRSIPDKYVTSN